MEQLKYGNAHKDITGNKYNYLTAIKYMPGGSWLWRCDCGNSKDIITGKVTSGQTKSCGCLAKVNAVKHGLIDTKEYIVWSNMKARCLNPKSSVYKNYGGRGITICNEWVNSFVTFFNDMGQCPVGMSLDRLDNDKGYSKENCKWRTVTEQNRNRRSNVLVTYNNIEKPLTQWCDELNLNYKQVFARIHQLHWSIEKALTYR